MHGDCTKIVLIPHGCARNRLWQFCSIAVPTWWLRPGWRWGAIARRGRRWGRWCRPSGRWTDGQQHWIEKARFFLMDFIIVMFNFINKLNNGSHFHASVKITDHSYARFFRYIKLKGLYITPHPRPLFGRSHLQHGFASPYPNFKAIKSYNKRW